METERGGWTLVANAAIAPVQDRGVEYYAGLGSMEGGTPGAGIWQALRETLRESPADVRFTCRVEPAGPSHDVDLSFYAVDWYQQLSVGGDHQSCFLPAGVNSINPARRNNLTGESLVLGTPWVNGNMVGESTCHDPLDFSVDFQDSGVGGDPEDGTDWGADDGFTKCGSNRHAAGTWQVWVREAEVTCVNSVLDEGEEGVDCGGPCAPCPQPCATDDECSGSVCRGGVCVVPRCNDRVMNGTETDVDCGGECSPCELGQMCGTLADCVHGICEAGYCRSGECYNRLKDPLETDVDCGGDCFPCALGMACLVSRDCAEGGCYGLVCALTSCGSSVKDGDETDVDCGGSTCEPCGSGQACLVARDCAEGGCFANLCAATSCGSQVRDGDESDVDCGGTCSPCVDGRVCRGGADCEGGRCADGTCVTLRCDDGVRNDDESDADCGGSCPACRDGLACNADQDCAGGACVGGVCATAFCVDGEISGNETDVDCGGACAPCATGKICSVHGDCASRACVERVCAVMTCANGQLTPGETDVDCGGPDCAPCAGGRLCQVDGDCVSQSCNDGRCLAGHCGNNRWDPGETGVDCGGECYRCPLGQECVGPEDCLSGNCAARLGGGPMTCAPWCGNVEVEPGEDCDDGNGVGGDGCSWDCKTEPMSGDRCNPIGSTPATCGQTCASHGMVANGNWTCVDPFVSLGGCTLGVECVCGCTAVFCGNQAVNQGEECDDGNRRDGDGCDRFCRVEECGDGVWNAGEECDDGNTTVDDGCTGGCTITEGYACRNIPPVSTGATGWGGQAQVGSRDLVWSWSETLNGLRVPATVCGNCAPGSWVEPPGHAQWVNRYGCGLNSPSDADTFYHATFTIPSDTAAAKTVVEALAWADNVVTEIRVNGVVAMVGNPESGFSGPGVYFGAWPSTLYHAGENVITVVVHNGTGFEGLNPDGLLVVTPPVQVVGSLCLLEGSCPEGFADRDQDPGTPCEPCVAGEYCPGGLEPAWTCPPGTFDGDRHPATPCDPCGPGWYCAGGPVDPLLCEGDFFDWDEDPATPCDEAYRVGGEVMGLPGGNEVVVQLNGDETLFLGVDGWFQFWTLLPVGSSYLVTAVGADGGTACTVRNGSGTVTGPVVDVEVQCGL
jgi:cysteine-rich repeat protein